MPASIRCGCAATRAQLEQLDRAGARRHRPRLRRRRGLERPHRGVADRGVAGHDAAGRARRTPGMRGRYAGALAQGDRIIAPSNYSAVPIMERYGVRAEQHHHRAARDRHRDLRSRRGLARSASDALRERWRVAAGRPRRDGAGTRRAVERTDPGARDRAHAASTRACAISPSSSSAKTPTARRYARDLLKRAQAQNVDDLFRMVGHCDDMPAAFAAADCRRGSGHRAAAARPRRRAGAGHGSAGRHLRHRRACRSTWWRRRGCRKTCAPAGSQRAGDPADFAHALRRRAVARRQRLSRDVRACAAIRGIHVFAGERCRSDAGGLYVAAGARSLVRCGDGECSQVGPPSARPRPIGALFVIPQPSAVARRRTERIDPPPAAADIDSTRSQPNRRHRRADRSRS